MAKFTFTEESKVLVVAISLVLAVLARSFQTTASVQVDVLLTDSAGRVLAGVELGDRWNIAPEGMSASLSCRGPSDPERLCSDAEGRVRGCWTLDPFATPLLALDCGRGLAAFLEPRWTDSHEAVVDGTIVLRETVAIRLDLICAATQAAARIACLYDTVDFPRRPRWHIEATMTPGRVEFPLPVTDTMLLQFHLRSRIAFEARTMGIEETSNVLDLGRVSLPSSPLERIGELLPDWHVDATQGLASQCALPYDFRGHPLLVVFRVTPEYQQERRTLDLESGLLQALRTRHDSSAFQVLIFRIDAWSGSGPPPAPPEGQGFPGIVDWLGRTTTTYGPIHDGEVMLLDPEGRLRHMGHVASIDASIAALEGALRQ